MARSTARGWIRDGSYREYGSTGVPATEHHRSPLLQGRSRCGIAVVRRARSVTRLKLHRETVGGSQEFPSEVDESAIGSTNFRRDGLLESLTVAVERRTFGYVFAWSPKLRLGIEMPRGGTILVSRTWRDLATEKAVGGPGYPRTQ